jgi:hypothetical protein
MACTLNTLTLEKDKDSGIKLESATPAVDQPDGGVDRRDVRGMLCSHFTITTWSTAATLFSFISFTIYKQLYKKENIKGILQ